MGKLLKSEPVEYQRERYITVKHNLLKNKMSDTKQSLVIKPCPFCGEGVMGNKYPCWKYTIAHKDDCYIRKNFEKKSYVYSEIRNEWNTRVLEGV